MNGNTPQIPAPSNLPAVQTIYNVPPPGQWYGPPPDYEPEPPGVPLSHYFWILRRHKWRIAAFVVTCVAATAIVSSRLTPIYESTATVDVDRRAPAGIIGQEATQYPTQDADQFLATQVKLIQSDSVLRPVVEKYHLRVARPEVPAAAAADAPVELTSLKVTRPPNTYLLLISYRSPDPRLAADVANSIANSYIEHTYNIRYRSSTNLSRFMEKQLEELKAKMERSSAALVQFERELNVINPEEKTGILSARLLQLNTEYTSAQGDRLRKEAAWNSVRSGTAEAAQVSTQGEALQRLTDRIADANQKFAEVKAHYGTNHPEYRKANAQLVQLEIEFERSRQNTARRVEVEYREALNRERMLENAVAKTKAEADALNARSFEYQALKREADADKKLYEELTTRIKEAGINAGFQNSSIRLADLARPGFVPVFPKMKLNLVLAFLFSSLLAAGAAVLSDTLDNTVRDPEAVQRTVGTEVVGSLPLVRDWRKGGRRSLRHAQTLALAAPGAAPAPPPKAPAPFRDAVAALRNSILLGFNSPPKSLLITSALPQEGKTTTAVHLALAHAGQKHRTLLIDADLRRPGIAGALGIKTDAGLSTVLQNGMLWREKLLKVEELPTLDVLAAGAASRRSVDLLGAGLAQILDEAGSDYDLIVVDAPPLLGFPEPLQLAAAVDGVVVVSLAGKTNRKAVASVVQILQRLKANVVGLVLNEVGKHSGGSYGYYGYGYYGHGKYREHYRHGEDAE
jgi:succinoglycan biosynthesis transport protein ExoP